MGRPRPEAATALALAAAVALAAASVGLRFWQVERAGARKDRELVVLGECRPWVVPCEARTGGLGLRLRFEGPVAPLRRFRVRVEARGPARPKAVSVRFEMPGMEMGQQPVALAPDGAGGWSGEAVLPVCATGRTDWVAVVRARAGADGEGWVARFPFIVR